MKRKFIHDISANTLQVIINQVCGVTIFYVLSVYFSKNDFGEINWALAVLLTAFSISFFWDRSVSNKKNCIRRRATIHTLCLCFSCITCRRFILCLLINFLFFFTRNFSATPFAFISWNWAN